MKFALVNGERREAEPDLAAECLNCGKPMVAKCGEVRVWHWAHKGSRLCDPWWENETEWHRSWKERFPSAWQEIVQVAGNGERHIADVKTEDGRVVEFQHSYIRPEERRSREAFYTRLIWVVDGMRRKRDKAQLLRAWKDGVGFTRAPMLRKAFVDECALLRDWAGARTPSFFDLGEPEALWCLLATSNGWAHLHPVSRSDFIEWLRNPSADAARRFEEFVSEAPQLIAAHETRARTHVVGNPLQRRSVRRHFRF